MSHVSFLKEPKVQRAAGRARPDEPLMTWCEIRLAGCTGRAQVRHHRLGRGQGGSDDQSNTLDICDADHRYIHAHPAWVYRLGYLLHRKVASC